MNLLIMALEGILFVAIAVWYVWTIAQKVRLHQVFVMPYCR